MCYLRGLEWRYKTRRPEDPERAAEALKGIPGKRLTFGGLTKPVTLKQKARHFLRRRLRKD